MLPHPFANGEVVVLIAVINQNAAPLLVAKKRG